VSGLKTNGEIQAAKFGGPVFSHAVVVWKYRSILGFLGKFLVGVWRLI